MFLMSENWAFMNKLSGKENQPSIGATEEQEEGNNIIGTCGAGSVFTPMDLEPHVSSPAAREKIICY